MSRLLETEISDHKYMKLYKVSFQSMTDLYMCLSEKPKVNEGVFLKQSSILGDARFAGEDYDKALEYCIGGYNGDYSIVMRLQKELEKYVPVRSRLRKKVRSLEGSHPNVPAFVAGSPKAMYRQERAKEKKFCTINFNLAYPVKTTKNAILNRGALALSLVRLLEAEGMGVNLKVFMSSMIRDELFLFEITLKSPQELLNAKKCFYPLCSREFVRRIVLRVMESVPFVSTEWYPNYGQPLTDEQFRNVFEISENDYIISSPDDMGAMGENIFADGAAMFEKMGIADNIVILLRKASEEECMN